MDWILTGYGSAESVTGHAENGLDSGRDTASPSDPHRETGRNLDRKERVGLLSAPVRVTIRTRQR